MDLTYWLTPGHGYLQVPRALTDSVGFVPTPYSYGNGSTLFLEEDCDMPAFLLLAEVHPNSPGVDVVEKHAPWAYPPADQCQWAVEGTSTYERIREASEEARPEVRPDGPETAEGGLIGQMPY